MSHHNLISEFNKIYYNDENNTWKSTHWLGTPIQKFPTDLWIYQELIYKLRPDLIVETGTLYGGSALFLATILEAANHGRVISVDISDGPDPEKPRPRHRRLKYIKGSSTDEIVLLKLEEESAGLDTVMVILDSDHSKEHVLAELTSFEGHGHSGKLSDRGRYQYKWSSRVSGFRAWSNGGRSGIPGE